MSTPIWASISNTAWSTAGNWTTASVPISGDTAILPISPRPEVNLRGTPPVSDTVHTSSSATKNTSPA